MLVCMKKEKEEQAKVKKSINPSRFPELRGKRLTIVGYKKVIKVKRI